MTQFEVLCSLFPLCDSSDSGFLLSLKLDYAWNPNFLKGFSSVTVRPLHASDTLFFLHYRFNWTWPIWLSYFECLLSTELCATNVWCLFCQMNLASHVWCPCSPCFNTEVQKHVTSLIDLQSRDLFQYLSFTNSNFTRLSRLIDSFPYFALLNPFPK